MSDIFTDPDDFCRSCRGRGSWSERLDNHSPPVAHVCGACGGTGKRTMMIVSRREDAASLRTMAPLMNDLLGMKEAGE